ncbi:MAG TPA: hypothetical protein PKW95_16685 [bacterium]|nr:hypothetical protein [bacterium]
MSNDLPAEKTSISQYEPPSAIVVRLYMVFTIFTLLLVPEIYLFGNFVERAIVRFGGYIGWRRFWMLYLGRIVNDHFILTLGLVLLFLFSVFGLTFMTINRNRNRLYVVIALSLVILSIMVYTPIRTIISLTYF